MVDKKFLRHLIILNLLTSAHCTATHMGLNMTMSYIASNSIYIFTFFTGLYLMSMGFGVLIVERISSTRQGLLNAIVLNSMLGILLANPGIYMLVSANEWARTLLHQSGLDLSVLIFALSVFLTIIIGLVSGAELPLFSKLSEKEKWPDVKPMIGILSSDYIGAFIGILGFVFILNLFHGLFKAILISQSITLIYIFWIVHRHHKQWPKWFPVRILLYIITLYILFCWLAVP